VTRPVRGLPETFLGALLLLLVTSGAALEVEQGFSIPAGGSCLTAECHTEQAKKKYIHAPARQGETCHQCHQQPEPDQHFFEPVAKGGDLCHICHEPTARGRVVHAPVMDGMCTACHDPHQSDHKGQLKRKAGPDLCLTCHARDGSGDQGSVHAPYQSGMCLNCHGPHFSDTVALLRGNYPDGLYAPYGPDTYFCFKCHGTDPFDEPRTLDATQFRNGNLNLHFRHVNRDKGRSCRACHHPHASVRAALIREQMPFGTAELAIGAFQKTETGGSCAPPCHQAIAYDRLQPAPVGMKVSPRPGQDASPEELQQVLEGGGDDEDW